MFDTIINQMGNGTNFKITIIKFNNLSHIIYFVPPFVLLNCEILSVILKIPITIKLF